MTWENVSFGKGVITVEQSKSGRIRHIPMNHDVAEALRALECPRSGSVFKWHGDSIQSITRSFETALRHAGIKRCRFHDLRHAFATNLVLGGVDLVTAKELLGHADITMTMRYAHPSPETKRKAVEALLLRKESGTSVACEEKAADGSETQAVEKNGAPETIRTSDKRFRKPLLYPSELRGRQCNRILFYGPTARLANEIEGLSIARCCRSSCP
jgi:hypothetical protein